MSGYLGCCHFPRMTERIDRNADRIVPIFLL